MFPGDRRVWLVAAAVLISMVGLTAYELLQPRSYFTGTDGVGVRSVVATLKSGRQLCLRDVTIPGGTGAIQFAYGDRHPIDSVALTVIRPGQPTEHAAVGPVPATKGITSLVVPLAAPLPARPQATRGVVCLRMGRGGRMDLAGFAGLFGAPATIDGRPISGSVAVWFLPPAGQQRSLVSNWPNVMARMALFRPGFAGRVFYWLLFVLGLPLLAYFGLRLLALPERPRKRLLVGLAAISVAGSAFWASTTVAFDAPDESEHFAYTQLLAETGQTPSANPAVKPPYATSEGLVLAALHHFSFIAVNDTRPPWFPVDQRLYRQFVARTHPSSSNGGGSSVATSVHSPLYYALLAPGYAVGSGGGVFSELFWMRLTSALMGAIVVLAAFATLRELMPSRPELAVAGALLIAFQPMFSFMAGSVNNDNGVNALAALAVFLTIRILRRGLTWKLGIALGITAALLPIMKGTGLALLPGIAAALLIVLVRQRSRMMLLRAVLAIAGFLGILAIWQALAGSFHRSVSGSTGGTSVARGAIGGKLTYLWEAFLPRLPSMPRHWPPGFWPFYFIYVKRGFAAFGWVAVFFPSWIYGVILAVMVLLGGLALVMAVRLRARVRQHWAEALFLVLVILAVVVGVEFAYYAPTPRPNINLTPEQGRYAFTAIVPLVALALSGLLVLPRRWSIAVSAALVAGMIGLCCASHLLYAAQNFA